MLFKSVCAAAFAVLLAVPAGAAAITFEWTEGGAGQGSNSTHQSRHGVNGPVLADDFVPTITGRVTQVDWWGSAPITAGAPDDFELTFHTDAGGVPAATGLFGGISQKILPAAGSDPDGDGVYFYSVAWVPQDLFLVAGGSYWFSVANDQFGWNWANAGGAAPTVGTEAFTGVVSTGVGPNGGPHFGPWNPVSLPSGAKQDFAFRVWVAPIPVPASMPLLAGALGLCAAALRRRQRRRA